ncbi:MAG: FtsW/RodA/SpoVE family cell cycle protein [Phycisphaerales bacterium JB060]
MRPGWTILICVLTLLGVGLVMVRSADMRVNAIPTPEPLDFSRGAALLVVPDPPDPVDPTFTDALLDLATSRSAVYAGIALLCALAVAAIPVGLLDRVDGLARMQRPGVWLAVAVLLIVAVLLLVYVPGLSREAKGAKRWVELSLPGVGLFSWQPSEVAKWALPAAVAVFAAARGPAIGTILRGLIPAGIGVGLVCGLIMREDLGTAVIIGAACGVVLLAAGIRWWHVGVLTAIAIAGAVQAVRTSQYRMDRITSFLNPYADPADTGYHMIQSLAAISGGELTGRGLGNGLHKLGYLPEDTTDFLFAIICEELGVIGAAGIVGVFALLIWACIAVIRNEKGPACQLIALGITATVSMQAIMNLAVVTGLGPTKGIALPLVSAGGTGWVLTAASLGLLIAMDRRQAAHTAVPSPITDPEPLSEPGRQRSLFARVRTVEAPA